MAKSRIQESVAVREIAKTSKDYSETTHVGRACSQKGPEPNSTVHGVRVDSCVAVVSIRDCCILYNLFMIRIITESPQGSSLYFYSK